MRGVLLEGITRPYPRRWAANAVRRIVIGDRPRDSGRSEEQPTRVFAVTPDGHVVSVDPLQPAPSHQSQPAPVVLFDIDGTLVDSNYQNALAWYRAFRAVGLVIPVWEIHRHMGMGGDQLVAAVAGDDTEKRSGDELRDRWSDLFAPMLDEVAAVEGATELLRACVDRGLQVVLASSGAAEHVEHYVDLLDVRDVVHAWTTSDDVERTKPDPGLLQVARSRTDGGPATMVGDSPWDVEASRRAGLSTVTVLTGGFSRDELQDAGAKAVVTSLRELADRLDLLTEDDRG